MKSLLLMIKQLFMVVRKKMLIMTGITLGGYLLGLAMTFLIANVTKESSFSNLGAFMANFSIVAQILFGAVFMCSADFVLAIINGKSRKDFLIARYLIYVVEFALSFLIVTAGNAIDKYIGTNFYAEYEPLSVPSGTVLMAFAVVLPALVMLGAALYVRFERKAFWGFWALWMLITVGGPRVLSAMRNSPESAAAKIGFFIKNAASMGSVQFFIVLFTAGVAGFIANFFVYRYLEAKL